MKKNVNIVSPYVFNYKVIVWYRQDDNVLETLPTNIQHPKDTKNLVHLSLSQIVSDVKND
jgi:hypothetical protein